MATVSPLAMAQCLVPCPTCETSLDVDWKCNLCGKYFCYRFDKIHVSIEKNKDHRVYNVNKKCGLPILSTVRCHFHSEKDISTYCPKCDKFMCTKCLGKSKNCEHSHMELEDLYVEKMKTLDKNCEKIKVKFKDFFIKEGERLKKIMDLQKENYETERQKIIEHGQTLKDMITQRTNKLLQDLEDPWKNIQHDMNKLTSLLKRKIQNFNNKLSIIDEIKKCIHIENIYTMTNEIKNFVHSEDISFVIHSNEIKRFLKGQVNQGLVDELVGTLKSETINPIDFRGLNSYTTDIGYIGSITAADENTVWIKSTKFFYSIIRKIKLSGELAKTLKEIEYPKTMDITLLKSGHLLIRDDPLTPSAEETTFYKFPKTWFGYPQTPLCLHINSEGSICVGTKEPDFCKVYELDASNHRQVVILSPKGERLKLYEYDGDGNRLFTYPHRITSNKCGDVCVADMLEDYKGRLVTINSNGKLKWIYTGHSESNHKFHPEDLVTTSQDNIIVCDFIHAFYILNYEGQLIEYMNAEKFGKICPLCMDIDHKGRLITGCLKDSNNVNLHMLLFTGC